MSEQIVSVDEDAIKTELRDLVKSTVEQTINALLDKEADELVGAERYDRCLQVKVDTFCCRLSTLSANG
jgi:hypothetical protein